tara:strand:- start:9741 stop:10406 length:666 start_codon:yes stop_codon:yes gene_type:complete
MRIESHLCHISENRAIVLSKGWNENDYIGSALGEATTAEEAEDKAILRLKQRLNSGRFKDTAVKNKFDSIDIERNKGEINNEIVVKDNLLKNDEPSDWSIELTKIDSEIKRLEWSKSDENLFLEKNLGYKHRSKIINYNDLIKYLDLLKSLDCKLSNNDEIKNLLDESDSLLKELSWDNLKGREYLQNEFQVSTRKELDIKQLNSFVNKLKSIRYQIGIDS